MSAHWGWQTLVLAFLVSPWLLQTLATTKGHEEQARNFFNKHSNGDHTNNWAVLVCASRYWFNYRHMANALGMYRTVKRLGIPDSNIILMLADDAACNNRNKFPGNVYANPGQDLDLYGDNIEVDYRGYEVTVENFIRLLTGRVDPSVPRTKRLLTDDRSNIFVYMTGHGGNEFLKFQDNEEISAFDIADAFEQMWQKKRYNEIFFMIDTCQATTMYSKFYSPNILATGSSQLAENSYSYENDRDLGVSVIDTYTHYVLEYLEQINKTSQLTMQDLFNIYEPQKMRSTPGVRSDLFARPLDRTLLTDFFGGVSQAEVMAEEAIESHMRSNVIEKTPHSSTDERKPKVVKPSAVRANTLKSPSPKGDGIPSATLRAWGGAGLIGLFIAWIAIGAGRS
ncbi:hypothetical protein BDM02DRAFT_3168591 [Thelephora ganbajun]|uniref:Uncharacterized protein n=1 Tax=Thelephora ganbajun TaxID=370292 RepID=A0ACB6ZGW5_THEGA|nr:hypothetical protein BDM02DRAFT_3168591 [Thelephora ganbajun]